MLSARHDAVNIPELVDIKDLPNTLDLFSVMGSPEVVEF